MKSLQRYGKTSTSSKQINQKDTILDTTIDLCQQITALLCVFDALLMIVCAKRYIFAAELDRMTAKYNKMDAK